MMKQVIAMVEKGIELIGKISVTSVTEFLIYGH
jgi:hypothetical protein